MALVALSLATASIDEIQKPKGMQNRDCLDQSAAHTIVQRNQSWGQAWWGCSNLASVAAGVPEAQVCDGQGLVGLQYLLA